MRLPTRMPRQGDPFGALHRDVERLFEDFTRNWPNPRGALAVGEGQALMPSIDVHETDNGLEVTAEIPGVDEKDVDVTLSDNVLTIKGEKKSEREEKDEGRVLSERTYGSFQRSFSLPYEVDAARVEATFEKGVLTVSLPKSPETRSKTTRIDVKTG